jgi:hypothetical protein
MADQMQQQAPQDTPPTSLNQEIGQLTRDQAPVEAAPSGQDVLPTDSQEMAVSDTQKPLADEQPETPSDSSAPEIAFRWQASEYVHNYKNVQWYGGLAAVVVALIGLAIWQHLWLEIGVFIAAGVAVLVYARKPPRMMMYELSAEGIHIDGRLHSFAEFRSFGVIPDIDWHTIDLEPTQRLRPRTALLFNTEDFDSIVGHLELHLPRADRQLDMIERISHYLRF